MHITKSFNKSTLLSLAFLFTLPFLLSAIRLDWLFTHPYVLPWFDPFVYLGFFLKYPEYVTAYPTYYPGERLSVIIPGYIIFHLFEPATASACIRFCLYILSAVSVFITLFRFTGTRAAIFAATMMGLHPCFLTAIGWDYVDGFGNTYHLMAYALASQLSFTQYRKVICFALGIMLTFMILSTTFMAAFFPPLIIFSIWRLKPQKISDLYSPVLTIFLGGVISFVIFSLINWSVGGPWFLFGSQLNAMIIMLSGKESLIDPSSWQPLFWTAPWAALPIVMGIIAIPSLITGYNFFKDRANKSEKSIFEFLFAIFTIYQISLFLYLQFTSFTVLSFFCYATFLVPITFIYIGTLLQENLESLSQKKWNLLFIALIVSGLVGAYPKVGHFVMQGMGIEYYKTYTIVSVVSFFAALIPLITTKANMVRLVGGVCLLSIANITAFNTPQLNNFWTEKRTYGIRAIAEATEYYQSKNSDGKLGVWMNTKQEPLGSNIFYASWISSHVRSGSFRSFELPVVDEKNLQPDIQVMAWTYTSNVEELIQPTLNAKGYKAVVIERRRILHSRIDFWMSLIKIVKM